MSNWSPEEYERFREERSQPFYDLLALVHRRSLMRIVDLGCGTGDLTSVLHHELKARKTLGVDSSDTMLAKAAASGGYELAFQHSDIASWVPDATYDLVFSNAALHWIPDHPALFAKLAAMLAEGGQLAVQMPANFDHPSHAVAREIAKEFAEPLAGYERQIPVLAPEAYAILLDGLGFKKQRVRLEVYVHKLPSRDSVIDWVKGTLLTDYRGRLDEPTYEKFLVRYRERLFELLVDTQPYLYPFKRLLIWAEK